MPLGAQAGHVYLLSIFHVLKCVFLIFRDVPANSAACVTLPASTASQVSDYGTPLADAEGISNIIPGSRTGNPNLTFTAASGTYNFQVANPVW